MSEQKQTKKTSRRAAGGILIPAGLFIGMGIGFAFNQGVAGLFIGLGAGFLAFALVFIFARD